MVATHRITGLKYLFIDLRKIVAVYAHRDEKCPLLPRRPAFLPLLGVKMTKTPRGSWSAAGRIIPDHDQTVLAN